ncbi:MAG: hypothetical protein IT340_01825 [Chloroflexi bacterium]|nr:hypothetical protein [Chloroflexota bacterium]
MTAIAAPTAAPATPAPPDTTWWRLSRYTLPIAGVLIAIGTLAFLRRTDPDFWWHVRAGRDMLANGTVPRVDPYSYTMAGAPWVAHSWLWEVTLAGVYDTAGYGAVSALLAGLLVATFWLTYRLLRARGLIEWAAAIVVLAGALMSVQTLTARPHAVTYLGIAVTAWLLEWWRRGQERRLWWLLPLMALWVNIHGGYAIGLGLVGLTLVGELLDARLVRRRPRLATLAGVLAGGLVTSSLNPQGPAIHLFAAGFLSRDSAMQRYIQEWASPDFHDWPGLILALSLVTLVAVGLRPGATGWSLGLPALAGVWQALQAVRHIPLYALVTLPAAAPAMAGLAPALAARPRLPEETRFVAVNWVAVALLAASISVPLLSSPLAQTKRAPVEEWYPQTALNYLVTHRPAGPIFNFDGWGGYLIERAPDYPVYIDGRTDLYGRAMLEEYRQVVRLEPGWRDILDQRGIQLVLVQRDSALAGALSAVPGWRLLAEGDVEVLFARAG